MKTINLGYANGWSNEDRELYKKLQENRIDNSASSQNIGNCLNEYSFEAIQENEIVKVIYRIDSGD
jgi:hypothetical protein